MARTLVVCCSRTGNTRRVAKAIAEALGADLELIADRADRRGLVGYLRSGTEALVGLSAEIAAPEHDPASYDLVVVGGPVWAMSVASPVRTWLWLERDRLPRLGLFITLGGTGADRVLATMASLAGKAPVATLAVRERDLAGTAWRERVAEFAAALGNGRRAAGARAAARRAAASVAVRRIGRAPAATPHGGKGAHRER